MAVFTENWRNSRKSTADANEAIKEYNDALSEFAKGYDKYYSAKYAKDTLDKGVSFKNMADTIKDYKGGKDNAIKKISDIIMTAGKIDGVLSDDSSEYEIAKYGMDFLNQLQNGEKDSFDIWFDKNATDEQKQAKKNMERDERYKREFDDTYQHKYDKPTNWGEAVWQGVDSGARAFGQTVQDVWNMPDMMDYGFWKTGEGKKRDTKIMEDMHKKYDEYSAGLKKEAYDMIYNYDEDMKNMAKQGKDGQKIIDLGLNTDNGLWGENGDVAYYTKQLNDQGIYGNLPVGKTIRLKRRK